MATLYEFLAVDKVADAEIIKQKILDNFLQYDAEHGGDEVISITPQLQAWPSVFLISYETLCDPVKRAVYDSNPKDYKMDDTQIKLKPNPYQSSELSNHISALTGTFLSPSDFYNAASALAVGLSGENLIFSSFPKDSEAALDAKIRLLGAKYLLRQLRDEIDYDNMPAIPGILEKARLLETNSRTASVAVELFVRHPHLKEFYNLVCQDVDPVAIQTLEDKVGGKKARKQLHDHLFVNEDESAFNKIRWLGDGIALLKTVNLDSPVNISLLIEATKKEQGERVSCENFANLLKAIPNINKISSLCNGSGAGFDSSGWAYQNNMLSLNKCLDKMFTHGLKILLENKANDPYAQTEREQAKVTLELAVELKNKLLDFGKLSKEQQKENLSNFQDDFKTCLHKQDPSMGKHRKVWKVISANILIALTGIGLLAIGANLAINHRFFGQRTHREKLRDNTEETLATLRINAS